MGSLADLFNPSFLMFLGILVLVIALLVVYFESKMRDQNHKIASMLSLVSTLAEDMNGMKIGLNQIALSTINGGGNNLTTNNSFHGQNLGSMQHLNDEKNLDLIEVSDDEEDEEDEEDETSENGDEDEATENEDNDEDEDFEELENIDEINESDTESIDNDNKHLRDENIKIIKINISQQESDSEENVFDLDNTDDLADLDCDFEPTDDIPEISEQYTEEILSLKYDNIKEDETKQDNSLEDKIIPSANLSKNTNELKTISINLGDEHNSEHIDFKKLQLPKLRSIAIEKGLTTTTEAQKLKKPDLLKLLGAE